MTMIHSLALITLVSPTFAAPGETTKSIALLKDLVSISSGTASTSGVDQVQDRLKEEFAKIGYQSEIFQNPDANEHSGKLLVATLPGTNAARFITLVGHADTVFEKLNPFQIDPDGKTAHGSGVVDDKGGLVVALAALAQLPKLKHSIRVVVSPSEETGSTGFKEIFQGFTKDSDLLLGLEPALESGDIVTARKGGRWYHVKITGKEAHAGAHHDEGVNACEELSLKITKLRALTDYAKGNTVSVGHIEGGKDKYNIVCGTAEAKIDVRYTSAKTGATLNKKIEAILNAPLVHSAKTNETTVTTFDIPEGKDPLESTPASMALLTDYFKIIENLEHRKIKGQSTGGLADLNTMTNGKVPVIDGFGPIGAGEHTANESIQLDSLNTRAQALVEFLEAADGKL